MAVILPNIEDLPQRNASHVKNRWGEVVREVQQVGTMAVTNHAKVEMVLLTAVTYKQLVEDSKTVQIRETLVLEELSRRFDERLGTLQEAQAAQSIDGLFAAKGKLRSRPRAGGTF